MPRPKRKEYDSDEFKERYLSSETLVSLARWLGVTPVSVSKAASRRGLPGKILNRLEIK